jgi:hypothetical protein
MANDSANDSRSENVFANIMLFRITKSFYFMSIFIKVDELIEIDDFVVSVHRRWGRLNHYRC